MYVQNNPCLMNEEQHKLISGPEPMSLGWFSAHKQGIESGVKDQRRCASVSMSTTRENNVRVGVFSHPLLAFAVLPRDAWPCNFIKHIFT